MKLIAKGWFAASLMNDEVVIVVVNRLTDSVYHLAWKNTKCLPATWKSV